MQQVIYLEATDLVMMKGGKTIQLAVGGSTIMLGYLGRTYKTSNGKHPVNEVHEEKVIQRRTAWNKGRKMKSNHKPPKRPCKICGRSISPLGMAPHMGKHRRDGEVTQKMVAR